MFDRLEILRLAGGMASHATARQDTIAKNVANADTPGYRAQDVADFASVVANQTPQTTLRATRQGHLSATDTGVNFGAMVDAPDSSSPNGNTVSLESEMMKAAEVRHQHDLALTTYKSSLTILKLSIGRR